MEKLVQDFLGKGNDGEVQFSELEVKVCTFRTRRVEVRDFGLFNRTMRGKWLWQFLSKEYRLQRRVMVIRYGLEWEGWMTKSLRLPYGGGLWKGIADGW